MRQVHVRVGPLQAIDASAMQWAWQAVTTGTVHENARLALDVLPWELRCPQCGRTWSSQRMDEECNCGEDQAIPTGSHEITLLSLDVDDVHSETPPCVDTLETSPETQS